MGRYCDVKKCGIRATFNYPGLGPLKCKADKLEGMIDVTSKKCICVENGERCIKQPSFNYPSEKSPLYCADDKLPGMVDVKSKKCDFTEDGIRCTVKPYFNFPDKTRGRRCDDHKIDGMVDVIHPRCIYIDEETDEKCCERAYYNHEDENSPLYCPIHKGEDMINPNDKKCEKCNKQPHYNFPGEKGGRFCNTHKLDGMIEVKHKRCEECDIRASFGPLFGNLRHCEAHKLANEFRNRFPICQAENCSENAYYTNDGTNYPRRCEGHVLFDDVNILEKPCKKCGLSFFLNEKHGLCDYCNDFFIKKVHKEKETKVIEFLKKYGFKFVSLDKIPVGGCSKYRPDAVIDYVYFLVILEIDEHQHSSYLEKCEILRMIQLQQDYGGIPIIFVRYNPDNYETNTGGKKNVIKPNDSYRLKELYKVLKRIEILKDNFEKEENKLPPLNVCYLFYDNFSEAKLKHIDIHKEIKNL
jgi:hypothetical protein